MTTLDRTGPAPEARSTQFLWLLFGASAAPLSWLGQTMLAYAVTAHGCFPGRYPQVSDWPLFAAVMLFNTVAVAGALAGGWISYRAWTQKGAASQHGRDHFLAVWGIFSSLCFFCAILFNIIATLIVLPCTI